MKKISQFFTRKKEKTPPLFQIRRHTFEYSHKNAKKRKKQSIIHGAIRSLSLFRLSISQLRIILIISMVIILSIGVIIFLSLRVSEIYITRENSLVDINEAYRNLEYLRGRSLLGLQKESIVHRLQSSQEVIRTVDMSRKFPQGLEVLIIPYRPLFQSSKGLIMSSGNIFTNVGERRNDIPWLDIVGYEPSLLGGGPDISLIDLEKIARLIEELEKNIIGFEVTQKKYYIKERELHIRDNAQTIYIFDLTHSIELQSEKLAVYFREKAKNPSERDMTYIDVRIPRGLFVCPLSEESICLRNLRNLYGDEAPIFTEENTEDSIQE